MKPVELFTLPIYEFKISLDLASKILSEISSQDNRENQTNTTIHPGGGSYYNIELFTILEDFIHQVKELYYNNEVNLVISECWGTKTAKFQKHHIHTHSNSIISGIVYLTDHPGATTEFYVKNEWCWTEELLKLGKSNKLMKTASVKPEIGKVILFPSNILHSTKPNLSAKERYTLSFNTFVSGKLGKPTTSLDITSLSVFSTQIKN
jgi:uncharacterized protein (TIGR02466 family)